MKIKLHGGRDPFEELRTLFAQSGPIEYMFKIREELKEKYSPSLPPLDVVLQCLLQHSPLFAKAWELANRKKKLTLHELDWSFSSTNAPAYYRAANHSIQIHRSRNTRQRFFFIVFETMNALQHEAFQKIDRLAEISGIDREEFTLIREYLEHDTLIWCFRIMGIQNHDYESFLEYWKIANLPVEQSKSQQPARSQVHADIYRHQWDLVWGFPFLKKHPEYLKRTTN